MRLIVLIALIAVALALALPARAHNTKLRAAGSLVSGGLIQQNKEQPFFENFAKKKVRVSDQSLAKFIEKLDGIPVALAFNKTQQALEVSLPLWAEVFDKSYDKCSATWKQAIGPLVGIRLTSS